MAKTKKGKTKKSKDTKKFKKYSTNEWLKTTCIGFPETYSCKLKYNDTYQLVGSTGATDIQVFKANSINDPDETGSGHRVRFWNQLTAIYQRYCVHAIKLKVYASNQSSTVPADVALIISEADPAALTVEDITELRDVKIFQLGTTGGISTKIASIYRRIGKIVGQRQINEDANLYAEYNADPAKLVHAAVASKAIDGASSSNVYVKCELTYYVTFKAVKNVAQST